MKKILLTILAIAVVSCSKDDSGTGLDSNVTELSISAYAPGYDEAEETKSETLGLWSQGDEVSVINVTTGKYLGNLTASSVSFARTTASFSGTLYGGLSVEDRLAFIYPAMPLQDSLPMVFQSFSQSMSGQLYNQEDHSASFCAVGYTDIFSFDEVSYDVDFEMVTSYLAVSVSDIPDRIDKLAKVSLDNIGSSIIWTLVDGEIVSSVGDDGSIDVECKNVSVSNQEATVVISVPESSCKERALSLSDGYFVYRSSVPQTEISPAELYAVEAGPMSLVNGFSVSQDSVVVFSMGNLRADTSAQSWSFASEQYEFLGDANVNDSTLEAKIDLFGWSGRFAEVDWGIGSSVSDEDYSGEFLDWGTNLRLIASLGSGWRTLSAESWDYLFSRKVSVGGQQKEAYGHANVMGVTGLLLLPDGWNGSVCSSFVYGNSMWGNTFDGSSVPSWKDMEDAGCVFLPMAGSRYGIEFEEGKGMYWSSTEGDSQKRFLSFEGDKVETDNEIAPCRGLSVRLVHP